MNVAISNFNEHLRNNFNPLNNRSRSLPNEKFKNQHILGLDENSFLNKEYPSLYKKIRDFSDLDISLKEEFLLNRDILKELNSSFKSKGILSLQKNNKGKSFMSLLSNDNNEFLNINNKKKTEAEKFKKKKADLGLQGLEIKIKDFTKKKVVNQEPDSSNKIPISPIFHGDDDTSSSKINHSFSSEIHLKNNKNYIPKEKLLRPSNINNCHDEKNNRSFSLFVESNVNKVISNEPSPIIILNDDNFPSPKTPYNGIHNSLFQGKPNTNEIEQVSPVEKIVIGQTYFDQYCISNNLNDKNKLSFQSSTNKLNNIEGKTTIKIGCTTKNSSLNNFHGQTFNDKKNNSNPYGNNYNSLNFNYNFDNMNYMYLNNIANQGGYSKMVNNQVGKSNNHYQLPINMVNSGGLNSQVPNQNFFQNYYGNINNMNRNLIKNNNNLYNINSFNEYQQTPNIKINENNGNMFYIPNNINYNYEKPSNTDHFYNNRNMNINYDEIGHEELSNYCFNLAKEQSGCRFLQKKLEDTPNLANDFIFPKIKYNIIDLIIDQFGNYFVQKMFEYLNPDKIYETLMIITPNFYSLCINSQGTRVIQKILEFIKNDKQKDKITELIRPYIIQLLVDINGNHIIQKFISLFPDNQFVFDIILRNFNRIITDKHGCCVMQKCIEVANPCYKEKIINSVVENTEIYISNQYANYVIQYIITLDDHKINRKITERFLPNIEQLSRHKFSSNVIEKVFDFSDENTKELILKSINVPIFLQCLLFDMYGNYVFQKALSVAKEPYYTNFIKSIIPVIENLKNVVSFGPKLFQKLVNTYPEISSLVNEDHNNTNNFHYSSHKYNENFNPIKRNLHVNPIENRNMYVQINNPINNFFPVFNNYQNINTPSSSFPIRNNLEDTRKFT